MKTNFLILFRPIISTCFPYILISGYIIRLLEKNGRLLNKLAILIRRFPLVAYYKGLGNEHVVCVTHTPFYAQ